jgi:DHA1 family bicyclomycin/chloramphenicol resistance-like MFS transporter
MLMSKVIPVLTKRWPPERVLAGVLTMMAAAGLLLLGVAVSGRGGFIALASLLFVYVAGVGGVMPLGTVRAMAPQGGQAGSASAVIGTLQFGLGAVSGALVGLVHDGTAVPMATVIAACGVAGWLAPRLLAR